MKSFQNKYLANLVQIKLKKRIAKVNHNLLFFLLVTLASHYDGVIARGEVKFAQRCALEVLRIHANWFELLKFIPHEVTFQA